MSTSSSSSPSVPRLFVSHSHKDNAFCRPFVAHLRAALGLGDPDAIFYDESALHYGDEWLDRIQREVIARPIFLVILTPNSVEADYVAIETRLAIRETIAHKQTRLLIPLLAEECDPNRLAPMLLDYQMADFAHRRYDVAFDELVAYLRTRLAPPDAVGASGGRPPASTTPSRTPVGALPAAPAATDPQAAAVADLLPGIQDAYQRHDWHRVIDKGDALLSEAPDATPASVYRLLGEARFQTGDDPRARAAFDTALAQGITDAATLTLAGQVCLRLNDPTAAEGHFKRALARVDAPAARLPLLRDYCAALSELKQWDELLRRADEGSHLAPDDGVWPRTRLGALMELHRDADALAVLRTLTARPDATSADWLARARLARAVGGVIEIAEAEARTALDAAARLAGPNGANDPAIAQARRELFPPPPPSAPPMAPEYFPDRLATLGFVPRTGKDPQTGKEAAFILPPTVPVPAGSFQMGKTNPRDPEGQYDGPARTASTAAFAIARYPVTVAEYACFVRAGQQEPSGWQDQLRQKLDHPVVYVSWHDATAYAEWLARFSSQLWRLPTEEEWEKAARWNPYTGTSRIYPWGDSFDAARCNIAESNIGTSTPVGRYGTSGASPVGAEDMAGNVWDWTSSLYDSSTENRVLRGGSWYNGRLYARAACRGLDWPGDLSSYSGFRLVVAPVRAGS